MNWFDMTLLLSLTGSTVVLSFRAITPDTNPFLFMTIVMGCASLALFGYQFFQNGVLVLQGRALLLAMLAGISVAVLDLAFIYMFRRGGQVAIVMPIFRVAAIMLSALLGFILFQESLTPVKLLGILTACLAIYLIYTKPKGEA